MQITNINEFLKYYSRIKYRTRRLFDYIPKDKIEWTFAEGKFTIGDLIRHLANIERMMYAENAQFQPSQYAGCGTKYAKGWEAVVNYYDDLQKESFDIFSKLTPEDLNKKTMTPGGVEITLWKWLRAMVEHEIHHRGQIYLYLSMLGIKTPPMFGMTSEEVAANTVVKKKPPYQVLYFLEGKKRSFIEIKRTDIANKNKSKIYQWLEFSEKKGKVIPLTFMSMRTTGEVEQREFTEGTLVFDSQVGKFSSLLGKKINFQNHSSHKLPKRIRKAIKKFNGGR